MLQPITARLTRSIGDWSRALRLLSRDTSLKRDSTILWVVMALTQVISLGSGIIVARALGPHNKGTVDLFLLLNGFVTDLGSLGLASGLFYEVASQRSSIPVAHGTAILASLTLGLGAIIAGVLFLPLWEALFAGLPPWAILLAFALGFLAFYNLIWASALMASNRPIALRVISLGLSLTSLGVISVFAALSRIDTVFVICLLTAIAALDAAVKFCVTWRWHPGLQIDRSAWGRSLQFGLVLYVGTLVNLIHFRVDQVMVNHWLGTRAVALYALGIRWAEGVFLLDNIILSAALYRISNLPAVEAGELADQIFKVQAVLGAGVALALALLARPLIATLYGQEYLEAAIPLTLLLPGIVGWSAAKSLSNFLSYNLGRASLVSRIAVGGMVLNVTLNVLLLGILHMGISGAACASSLSYLFVAAWTWKEADASRKAAIS